MIYYINIVLFSDSKLTIEPNIIFFIKLILLIRRIQNFHEFLKNKL